MRCCPPVYRHLIGCVALSSLACGSSGAGSPASLDVPGPRTLTVKVVVRNRLNNAVAGDVTLQATIGKAKIAAFTALGGWSYTVSAASAAMSYSIAAVDHPPDYSVNGCAGTLASDVTCEIDLVDGLAPPSCDPNLIPFLYRSSRFEGFAGSLPTPPCETTWGTVRGTEYEHDADAESWVQLTKAETARVLDAAHDAFNAHRQGLLVGEWICRGSLDDTGKAQGVSSECDNYRKYVSSGAFAEVPLPDVGDSGVFVGFKVHDCGHNCWTELHPLVWWHRLVHPIAADQF